MAQFTEKTLAWIESSVGASAGTGGARLTPPLPTESGCPFWSSPSPVPAPHAARASTITAIPPRNSKVVPVANRLLFDYDLPSNVAVSVGCRTVNIEVGIVRVEIRHILGGQCRRGRRGINICSGRQRHDVCGSTNPGCAGVDMRCICSANVVRDVADEDVPRRRVEHDGSLPGGRRRSPLLGAVQRGEARGDASLYVDLPADLPAGIHSGVDIEVESTREQLRVV